MFKTAARKPTPQLSHFHYPSIGFTLSNKAWESQKIKISHNTCFIYLLLLNDFYVMLFWIMTQNDLVRISNVPEKSASSVFHPKIFCLLLKSYNPCETPVTVRTALFRVFTQRVTVISWRRFEPSYW